MSIGTAIIWNLFCSGPNVAMPQLHNPSVEQHSAVLFHEEAVSVGAHSNAG